MKTQRPMIASAVSVAAGLAYLLEALFVSAYLEPCTSSGPVSPGPCDASVAAVNLLFGVAIAIVLLGSLLLLFDRSSLIWGAMVIAMSAGGFVLLIILSSLNWYSGANFVLLFLPALLLGVTGGEIGMRWQRVRAPPLPLGGPYS